MRVENPDTSRSGAISVQTGEKALAKFRVLLIGNYQRDTQESMLRFASVLLDGLRRRGVQTELLRPQLVVGRFSRSTYWGIGKWLAYFDKFVLFPIALKYILWIRERALRQSNSSEALVIHICDHSNAMYGMYMGRERWMATCHDLLAVRGALGEATDCPASPAGRILQGWVLQGLAHAPLIACVSTSTLRDVERLMDQSIHPPKTCLIPLGLNHGYKRLEPKVWQARLFPFMPMDHPYILHVGANMRRKNRDGVLRIFKRISDRWNGRLVFAGQALSDELILLADRLALRDRVVQVVKPDNEIMEALYNGAMALLFPSRFEGFGWPIIEAQACGCPVVCSNAGPLPEVAGEAGLVCDLEHEEEFAHALISLTDAAKRESCVRKGFLNLHRFTTERMLDQYLEAYRDIAGTSP